VESVASSYWITYILYHVSLFCSTLKTYSDFNMVYPMACACKATTIAVINEALSLLLFLCFRFDWWYLICLGIEIGGFLLLVVFMHFVHGLNDQGINSSMKKVFSSSCCFCLIIFDIIIIVTINLVISLFTHQDMNSFIFYHRYSV